NIIECKYHTQPFTIDKKYAYELENKQISFQESSNYMGSIQIVMLTLSGVKRNSYSDEVVSINLDIDALFN
ncbi:MAG: Archaeal ATPase, fused to C-terminal DUF234 domain, partial [uncultured Sulfurovum sp.]